MKLAKVCRTAIAMACAAFVAIPARAEPAAAPLSGYNADIKQSSISGISSGAFMAVQFGTAWSSVIRGVGVVAGGPFWCAQADANDAFDGYSLPFLHATGLCMSGQPLDDLGRFIAKADAKSASGDIDSPQGLSRQKIYVFHGYNDTVVAKSVTDAAVAFYRHYLGEANRGNLYYQTAVGAGHSLVVAKDAHSGGINDCTESVSPFIDGCGYDQAGIILQHIYGTLNKPNRGQLNGTISRFDQSAYTRPDDPIGLSLANTGYVFVPRDCEDGAACRVHIVLHGCLQDAGEIERHFVDDTGYNAWADTNRLIVLYPQAAVSWYLPYNPLACWDSWGYADQNDSYVTKSGAQVRTIKAMLDALTARAAPAGTSGSGGGCGARRAGGRRHLGHRRGSGVDAARGERNLPCLARGRRWPVRGGGRYDRPQLRRFRPEPAIRLSLAHHGRRQRHRRAAFRRGHGHHPPRSRLPAPRQLPDRTVTGPTA